MAALVPDASFGRPKGLSKMEKDIRGSVSKALLEQSQLDPSGLRIGKQRLVAKKKTPSKLKKVIMEDREDKQEPPAKKQPQPGLSQLCADAPAFMPTDWFLPASPELAAEQKEVASTERTAAKTATGPALPGLVSFVPSWCEAPPASVEPAPQEDRPGPAEEGTDGEEDVGPLTRSEAIERLRNLQNSGPGRGAQKAPLNPAEAEEKSRQKAAAGRADIEVRHYVHQELSDELDEKVKVVLAELVRFQERAKENELKFAKLKRYCVGLREAKRAITRNKCKGLIVAPNLELSNAEGGLDDTVEDLIELARDNEVPVIFALSRNRIGKAMGKNIRLSIVCIHSAEGVHQQFKEVVKLTEELRRRWVLRQMSHATSEYAAEAQRRAEEKEVRDAARRAEKERLAAEKAVEEERRREEAAAAKAARTEEKAQRVAAQKASAELRRAEKAARAKEREDEQAKETAIDEKREAAERKLKEDQVKQQQAVAKEADRQRREADRKAELEKQQRLAQAAAKRAAAEKQAAASGKAPPPAAAPVDEEDSDSDDSDLPLGFNSQLF